MNQTLLFQHSFIPNPYGYPIQGPAPTAIPPPYMNYTTNGNSTNKRTINNRRTNNGTNKGKAPAKGPQRNQRR